MPSDPGPISSLPVPPLLPGQPPLALLIDYDGTIATVDVADRIVAHFSPDNFASDNADYSAARMGSRGLSQRQIRRLPADPEPVLALAADQPHDPTFATFVTLALGLDVPVEVVSDGFGFYIEPALLRLGVPPIPVVTSRTIFGSPEPRMEFPNGHPDCHVCGTCKRQRVLAHQAVGRNVVFIGDGESDRYAAAHADLIFAKRDLVSFCEAAGFPFLEWHDFVGIGDWLAAVVSAWRVDSSTVPAHVARPFICGPEAWGPGRTIPPPRSEGGLASRR